MFFTKEDYLKIQEWLRRNAIKDTNLQDANPLEGKETLAIVQNGENVKVSLSDFTEQLYLLGIPDFINATDRYDAHSIEDAIKSIPSKSRKKGQVITFISSGGEWKIYQFQGERLSQWNTMSQWIDIIKESLQGFVPDEEDLTIQDNVVKFKDKIYNPDNFSGKGRVYLRKNIVTLDSGETVNMLTLEMLGKENTIYIVLYDYNLMGKAIIIPDNCNLVFEGGSFNNGYISNLYNLPKDKDSVVASEVGLFPNDPDKATINFSKFLTLVNTGYEIEFDGVYYISRSNTSSNVLEKDLRLKGGTIYCNSWNLVPAANSSIVIDNVKFIGSTENLNIIISCPYRRTDLMSKISITNCSFEDKIRLIYKLSWEDNLNNKEYGIRQVILKNNKVSNCTSTFCTITDCAITDECLISLNTCIKFGNCFFYFAASNEFLGTAYNMDNTCDISILDNYFDNVEPVSYTGYLCAILIEGNKVLVKNNIYKNIINISDLGGTAYDNYISALNVRYENNYMENIMSSRTSINVASAPLNEVFKSKATQYLTDKSSRIIIGNTVVNDFSKLLEYGGIKEDCYTAMWLYTDPIDTVIFDYNNIIMKDGGLLGLSSSTLIRDFYIRNNIFDGNAPKMGFLTKYQYDDCEYVLNNNIFNMPVWGSISRVAAHSKIIITNNKFNRGFFVTLGGNDTSIDSIVIKDNEFKTVNSQELTYHTTEVIKGDVLETELNQEGDLNNSCEVIRLYCNNVKTKVVLGSHSITLVWLFPTNTSNYYRLTWRFKDIEGTKQTLSIYFSPLLNDMQLRNFIINGITYVPEKSNHTQTLPIKVTKIIKLSFFISNSGDDYFGFRSPAYIEGLDELIDGPVELLVESLPGTYGISNCYNVDEFGNIQFPKTVSDSVSRPSFNKDTNIGTMVFDESLSKPIFWNGLHWVDSIGEQV